MYTITTVIHQLKICFLAAYAWHKPGADLEYWVGVPGKPVTFA